MRFDNGHEYWLRAISLVVRRQRADNAPFSQAFGHRVGVRAVGADDGGINVFLILSLGNEQAIGFTDVLRRVPVVTDNDAAIAVTKVLYHRGIFFKKLADVSTPNQKPAGFHVLSVS